MLHDDLKLIHYTETVQIHLKATGFLPERVKLRTSDIINTLLLCLVNWGFSPVLYHKGNAFFFPSIWYEDWVPQGWEAPEGIKKPRKLFSPFVFLVKSRWDWKFLGLSFWDGLKPGGEFLRLGVCRDTHPHHVYLLQFFRHVQIVLHRREKRIHPLLRRGTCTLTLVPSVYYLAKIRKSTD